MAFAILANHVRAAATAILRVMVHHATAALAAVEEQFNAVVLVVVETQLLRVMVHPATAVLAAVEEL